MSNCLVTKLRENVQNDNLFKLNDFVLGLGINTTNDNLISVSYATKSNLTLKVDGNAYFVDANNKESLGQTIQTGAANEVLSFYIYSPDKNSVLILPERDDIKTMLFDYFSLTYNHSTPLLGLTSLQEFRKFSLAIIKTKNIKNLPKLSSLTNYGNSIEGDINSIANCPLLHTIANNNGTLLTGDAALVSNSLRIVNTASVLSWSSRSTDKYIVSLQGNVNLGNDVDKYLIDSAAGVNPTDISGWQKGISVVGTKTSASNAAVATLKSYGYTVKVNGELL